MRLVRIFSVIMFLVGCGNGPAHLSPQQQPIPADTLIMLKRSACFGTCPDYRLTVSADGGVIFEGREFVKVKGVTKGTISLEKVRQLIAQFDSAKYFSLNDKYETEKDGCPEVWTDNPSVVTSIRINGKSKSVSHYHGCQEGRGTSVYPKGLTDLENQIDEIVGTKRWIE